MFGYLKMTGLKRNSPEYKIFKKFYCGTCASLRVNYGRLSTAVLSYDLVIVPLILSRTFDIPCECPKCNFRSRCKDDFDNAFWKKIAAFNLAMTYAHISDDVNDEKSRVSFKYKAVRILLKKALKKARNEFPHLFEICDLGILGIDTAEKNGDGLFGQSEAFSKMCLTMLEELFDISDDEKKLYSAISYWLCFSDAVDDYEKDRKKGRYNPLSDKYETRREFISNNYVYLFKEYHQIYEKVKNAYKTLCEKNIYSGIPVLRHLIYKVMPIATAKILQKR